MPDITFEEQDYSDPIHKNKIPNQKNKQKEPPSKKKKKKKKKKIARHTA